MFKCNFVAGVNELCFLPDLSVPEIAVAGRSNVGKSSFINAVTGNRRNARVSSSPGSTRQINFYCSDVLAFADLPGYGYSRVSEKVKEGYLALVEHYLLTRKTLHRVVLLVDSRVGLKEVDLDFIEWLGVQGLLCNLVLTKIDKITHEELRGVVCKVEEQTAGFGLLLRPILGVSNKSGKGMKELMHEIAGCIR